MEHFEDTEPSADDTPASNPNDPFKTQKSLMAIRFLDQLNLSPIQVVAEMPLTKIYTLFHVMRPENLYVTKYSRLIGVIHDTDLLTREMRYQTKRQSCWNRCADSVTRGCDAVTECVRRVFCCPRRRPQAEFQSMSRHVNA